MHASQHCLDLFLQKLLTPIVGLIYYIFASSFERLALVATPRTIESLFSTYHPIKSRSADGGLTALKSSI